MIFYRRYGEEATIDLTLYALDGSVLEGGATFEAGDLMLMQDEGTEAESTNLPTDEGQTYSLVLTATEMKCKRLKGVLVDQTGTQVWLDTTFVVETYANDAAMHLDIKSTKYERYTGTYGGY